MIAQLNYNQTIGLMNWNNFIYFTLLVSENHSQNNDQISRYKCKVSIY